MKSSISFDHIDKNEIKPPTMTLESETRPRYNSVTSTLYRTEDLKFLDKTSSLSNCDKKPTQAILELPTNDQLQPVATSESNVKEINAGGAPPVDESLFFDNMQMFSLVKIDGSSLMNKLYSKLNPTYRKLLMDMEKGLIPTSPDGTLFPDCDDKFKHVAYVWACFRNLYYLLPKFAAAGIDLHWIAPQTGVNAMSNACFSNSIECVEFLIKKGVNVNHVNPRTHNSCLHAAAIVNAREAAELLLKSGAKLNLPTNEFVEPLLHCAIRHQSEAVVKLFLEGGADVTQRNHLGETPLHVACAVQSVYSAKLLLSKPETDVMAIDQKHRTPLHFAVINIVSSNELVELLLENGAGANVPDESGFTALHIAALNEQSHNVESIIWAGADVSATTSKGISALNIIVKKIPETIAVFPKRMDASIRLKRPSRQNREFKMKLDLNILFPSNHQCEMNVINTFIQEGQKDLLCHPLIKAFLHLKWEKIRKFYLLRIILNALAVICMSIYVLTALAYNCYNLPEGNNNNMCRSDNIFRYLFQKTVIKIEWYFSASLMFVLVMPRKIIGITTSKTAKLYFSNIENILDIIVLICNFLISFIYTGQIYDWQKYVGAFAVLFAWTNLMFLIGQLPTFGTYIAMFTHIQVEFAKLLMAYSSLLIGFMISFCVLFITEGSFSNPLIGIVKVLSMMAGDLDFDVTKHVNLSQNGSVDIYNPLSVCSQILFSLFVIFIAIILMNLLVGIAVHDIQGLRTHAGLTKLVRQTKRSLYTELELNNEKIPYFIRKWIPNHKIDVYSGCRVLTVKPLNPLEKRLPKDILNAAYEIAQKNSPLTEEEDTHLKFRKFSSLKQQDKENTNFDLQLLFEKLVLQLKIYGEEIRLLKNQLYRIESMLTKILR